MNEYEINEQESLSFEEGMRSAEEDQRQAEQREAQEKAIAQENEQAAEEIADPRNAENWGMKGLIKEGQSILTGGIQDTISSVATFGERTVDALSGEMQKEREEKGRYTPDWDPMQSYSNPIVTKTWWGKLLRGAVHFGTLTAGTVLAAKGLAASGIPLLAGGASGLLKANSLVRAAGFGAVSDLVSQESDEMNALGSLRDHYGWMDTPISTREDDHPMMMKLKNIVEGMGIGLIFDGVGMALGKAKKGVDVKIEEAKARNKNIEDSTLAKGLQELREGESEFRAAKNRPIAAPHQGAVLSQDDPFIVWENQQRINKDWGSRDGAAGNVVTPVQLERGARESGLSEKVVDEVLRKLYSNNKYKELIESAKKSRQTLVETFGDAIAAHQRITQGRNAAEMSPKEYLEEILENTDAYSITDIDGNLVDSVETITSKYVVVTDMVVGTLLQQVRDLGIAGRELKDFVNIADVDGPLSKIRDTMFMALTEAKRARIIKSQNFRQLGAGKRAYLEKTLTQEMVDTRESIQSILNIADKSNDTNLLMALFEAFSSMKTVNSLDDFDAFARKMIKGGEIEGKPQVGAVVRELQGVMVHSILSGPKTPVRAIMGTATATFLRPMAQVIGATLALPFTGDIRTVRRGLASLNAMAESIPESFALFRSKLDSYWSGELSTVSTRFSEYTRGDDNWEIIRRWAEDSGRATAGDKAAFRLANMARTMNDKNFLTYSTKIMAATDDAFGYILGRARMREKALDSAFRQIDEGQIKNVTEITPKLIKDYEDYFYRDIFDADGNILDDATKFAKQEVTLTQDLKGFSANLNSVFQATPWVKPFFLFARTGVNGLKLTAKYTPGFNFLVKEFNDIAFTKIGDDLSELATKYGISTPEQLANAKAIQNGRLAIGSSLVFMASQAWLQGRLTGNGPVDRQMRQVWKDAGWQANTFIIGSPEDGIRISHRSFEPFGPILDMIADIGDASQLMGEQWTEDNLMKVSLLLAQGVTSKSYLAGLQSFVDLVGAKPGQGASIVANIANNTIPLGGLRKELGILFEPYMRELGSGIPDSIRNRNLLSEKLAGKNALPIKYDMFIPNQPVNPYDFMTRAYNAFSPIQMNLTMTPGKQLMLDSKYDLRQSIMFSPEGDDLTDEPRIRAEYARQLGLRNLEAKLARLAKRDDIKQSIEDMYYEINSGNRGDFEPMDFAHNRIINALMEKESKLAWANVRDNQDVQILKQEELQKKQKRLQKKATNTQLYLQNMINMYK